MNNYNFHEDYGRQLPVNNVNVPEDDNGYFPSVRKPVYNFLFILPLLVLYEFLIIATGTPIRNGADVIVKLFFNAIGIKTVIGFTLIIVSLYAFLVFSDKKSKDEKIYPIFFVFMLAESIMYAMILGPIVSKLTQKVIPQLASLSMGDSAFTFTEKLIVSLGAGIYEEFVFRYFLISLFIYIFTKFFDLKYYHAGAFAIFWAALIFSAFHYIGSLGDQFDVASFVFRFIAGVILSILYFMRGYGIAVYTHAIYDLKVYFF
ncbi:MAG: CPBP family intramembrane metalloprotease [Candidatus Wallbacteria bacterium]